jgi:tetratricopeptide (TPR) repeat protein
MKVSQIVALITSCTLAAGSVTAIASPVRANQEEAQSYLSECILNVDKLKNYQKAEAACDRAIELNPEYAEAYFFRGGARIQLQNYQGAETDLSKAAEIFKKQKNDTGYKATQELLLILQDLNAKSRNTNQNNSSATQPSSKDPFQQGLEYFEQGKNDLALAQLSKAIEVNPKNEFAYLIRGTIYGDKKQWDLALTDLDRAIELDPKLATAYFGRGVTHYSSGNRENAIADLKKAAQLYREQKDTKNYQQVTDILKKIEQ